MHSENGHGIGDARTRGGLLKRLARDTRGNTLAIMAAALVPLAGMIGSGVDMSRAYMAKSRLQSACDSAALAGRRVMTNDAIDTAVRNEATRFMNANFPQRLYGTAAFAPNITRPVAGTVRITANTTIPTSIMSLFGFESLPINVSCDASLNFVNTDVMLVLDVTGSMDNDLNGTKKIVALRDAVMALYDQLAPTQQQLEANGLRLRYGIVPYSSTVNVGSLIRDANADFIANNVTYQSRVANYDNQIAEYTGEVQPPSAPVEQTYSASISQSDCDKYGQNANFGNFSRSAANGGGPAPQATWSRTFSNDESSGVDWGWPGANDTSGTNRTCRRRYVQTNTVYQVSDYHYVSTGYSYRPEVIDVSDYKMGGSVTYATNRQGQTEEGGSFDPFELANNGTGMGTNTLTWNGCIEERATVNTITTASGFNIPANAFDLDINLIPHNEATRWRPMLPQLVWRGDGTNMANAACPAASRRLQAWDRAGLLGYVNGLNPVGSTYHDIGMIWGARMISNAGIFADSPDTFGAMPVARHIIFMTDGQMDTDNGIYAFQGIERNDQRVSGMSNPSESELNGRHMQRFQMICNATKGQNVSIWVIAFGTTLTTQMQTCASNANQASTITNRDQLIARFRQIGSNIGALRLTQ